MSDKIAVRSPSPLDFGEAVKDLVTIRAAPPVIVSAATCTILTGNVLMSVLAVGLTSYLGAVWSRLLKPE